MRCSVEFLAFILQFYFANGLLDGHHAFTTLAPTTRHNADRDTLQQLLTQEFLELEKSTRTLIQKVSVLEVKNADVEQELQKQRAEINLLKQENSNLKQNLQQQSTVVAGLQKDLGTCMQTTNLLKQEVEFSQTNITVLSDCCEKNKHNLSLLADRMDLVKSSMLQQMKINHETENSKLSNVSSMIDRLNTQNRYTALSLLELQLNISNVDDSLSRVVSNMHQNVSSQMDSLHTIIGKYSGIHLYLISNSIFIVLLKIFHTYWEHQNCW
jgi:chromosome segregation ATPase